jgi:hypothetical protein
VPSAGSAAIPNSAFSALDAGIDTHASGSPPAAAPGPVITSVSGKSGGHSVDNNGVSHTSANDATDSLPKTKNSSVTGVSPKTEEAPEADSDE